MGLNTDEMLAATLEAERGNLKRCGDDSPFYFGGYCVTTIYTHKSMPIFRGIIRARRDYRYLTPYHYTINTYITEYVYLHCTHKLLEAMTVSVGQHGGRCVTPTHTHRSMPD